MRLNSSYSKTRISVFALLAISMLSFAVSPAFASPPTTGTRIGLFVPPSTFPANSPFFVRHGFSDSPWTTDTAQNKVALLSGSTEFVLYVDEAKQSSTRSVTYVQATDEMSIWFLSNFPNGLPAGNHVLEGKWYMQGVLVLDIAVTIAFV